MNTENITASEFKPFYKELYDKMLKNDFVIDKSNVKMVELIAPTIKLSINDDLDGRVIFADRQSPEKYILQEFNWYSKHSLNIQDVSDVKIWQQCADDNNEINSNYGNLVYSKNNFSQFSNVVKTLTNHKESRQGIIIYTRPSIHFEWNSFNGSDFICTNYQQFFIRNDRLYCITNMRSQDVIYGLFSDIPWFFGVYKQMLAKLRKTYSCLDYGNVFMVYNSFHCYEKHFDILTKIANN